MKKWRKEGFGDILRGLILIFHFKHVPWPSIDKRVKSQCVVCATVLELNDERNGLYIIEDGRIVMKSGGAGILKMKEGEI